MNKKVLIITYYWPPSGGSGVQRWLKFAKYLPEFDWEPVILTIDPDYAAYPVRDDSLISDIPAETKVYRTKAYDYFRIYRKDKSKIPVAGFANNTEVSLKGKILRFIRGNFFIPDPRIGWNRYAFKKACEIIERENIENIITTSPPHSTQLIGLKLKKRYPALKWFVDLRDPWTDIYYYDLFYPTFITRKIDSVFEKRILKTADKIITVGDSLKSLFSSKINNLDRKIEVITNGFDESDFKNQVTETPPTFTITYAGNLSGKYSLGGLLQSLINIRNKKIDFILRFVGTISDNFKMKILSEIPQECVQFIEYTKHDDAIKFLMNSTMLLLVIPEHKDNRLILTGKLFEYIASGKPILCIGPEDGDAANILSKTNMGKCFSYEDTKKIEDYIRNIIDKPSKPHPRPEEFSRKSLTKQLALTLKN